MARRSNDETDSAFEPRSAAAHRLWRRAAASQTTVSHRAEASPEQACGHDEASLCEAWMAEAEAFDAGGSDHLPDPEAGRFMRRILDEPDPPLSGPLRQRLLAAVPPPRAPVPQWRGLSAARMVGACVWARLRPVPLAYGMAAGLCALVGFGLGLDYGRLHAGHERAAVSAEARALLFLSGAGLVHAQIPIDEPDDAPL